MLGIHFVVQTFYAVYVPSEPLLSGYRHVVSFQNQSNSRRRDCFNGRLQNTVDTKTGMDFQEAVLIDCVILTENLVKKAKLIKPNTTKVFLLFFSTYIFVVNST